jgi:HAD superfamily hydrolase (TIGR01490 family)
MGTSGSKGAAGASSANARTASAKPQLAIFDLDHTLLDGDSDVLWCNLLIREGVLDGAVFGPRNAQIEAGYKAGTIGAREFCEFFVGTLAGRSAAQWLPLRSRYFENEVLPRLAAQGIAQVAQHRAAGHALVLSTATNRYLTEATAQHLGFEHLIATECEVAADGRFSGRTQGVLNMKEGKPQRLKQWLALRGESLSQWHSVLYSDSINDQPLLEAVNEPIVCNPDARLAVLAAQRGWAVRHWFMRD